MSNYAIGHYLITMNTETRAGTEGLQTTGDEVNTNLAIVPELSFGEMNKLMKDEKYLISW